MFHINILCPIVPWNKRDSEYPAGGDHKIEPFKVLRFTLGSWFILWWQPSGCTCTISHFLDITYHNWWREGLQRPVHQGPCPPVSVPDSCGNVFHCCARCCLVHQVLSFMPLWRKQEKRTFGICWHVTSCTGLKGGVSLAGGVRATY